MNLGLQAAEIEADAVKDGLKRTFQQGPFPPPKCRKFRTLCVQCSAQAEERGLRDASNT
jgi:hypothetical protein